MVGAGSGTEPVLDVGLTAVGQCGEPGEEPAVVLMLSRACAV